VDLARQPIRVVLDDPDRRVAVALIMRTARAGRDAIIGEEDHHFLDRLLLVPGVADFAGAVRPRPATSTRRAGASSITARVVRAEMLDDPLGHFGDRSP
jgi:hypothetical protein